MCTPTSSPSVGLLYADRARTPRAFSPSPCAVVRVPSWAAGLAEVEGTDSFAVLQSVDGPWHVSQVPGIDAVSDLADVVDGVGTRFAVEPLVDPLVRSGLSASGVTLPGPERSAIPVLVQRSCPQPADTGVQPRSINLSPETNGGMYPLRGHNGGYLVLA